MIYLLMPDRFANGNPNNDNNSSVIEKADRTKIDGRHGGTNDDDSSGVMTYCRVEFAGIPLSTASNSEINGITFYSVGRKTLVDNVQVSYSGDDSYEWFGGTVNAKHLIAFAGIDDDFDSDNGFRGQVQFAIGARIPQNADQSGSNGFESDNDASGSTNSPRTAAIFSNVTMVGPYYNGQTVTPNANFGRAAHIRRNSALTIVNSIFTGFPVAGLIIDSATGEISGTPQVPSPITRYIIRASNSTNFTDSQIDITVKNMLEGKIKISDASPMPIEIMDKRGWNTFFDSFDIEIYKYVIITIWYFLVFRLSPYSIRFHTD